MKHPEINRTPRPAGAARHADQRGFTLVEMLVVIAKTARIQIQSFSSALDLFYLDTGRYPTTSEGLAALVRPVATIPGWAGPYLKGGNVPSDPWSHAYVYRSPGQQVPYEILSYGADGQEGGTDLAADISSSTPVGVR